MRFLLRTLSLSYVRRHLLKTLLTIAGVAVGVATYASIRTARGALIDGLLATVDRIAGKAHLQVSSDTGVPEEILERLYELPGVRATAPVIEQIVLPETPGIGSILVLGVDLLGDREMRDYGFSGEDADLDDPLLFLAQADSIALSRSVAERAGLRVGDSLTLRVTAAGAAGDAGTKRVVVRGLLETKGFTEGFGGNIAVMDVYAAQTVFGRGRRFDRIEVRLEEGTSIAAGTAVVKRAAGPGLTVETPARRGGQMEKLIANFVVGFSLSSFFALAIGTFLIFNAFSVAVNRRRRDIGTLRALGATPRQVQALFLLEALWVGLVGGLVGLAAGAAVANATLAVMGDAVAQLYGFREVTEARLDTAVLVQSLLLGVAASLIGAWGPARAAARVHPTEALAKGAFMARRPRTPARRIAIGAALLVGAIALDWSGLAHNEQAFMIVLVLGSAAIVLLAGPLARLLLLALAPLLARLAPVAGPLATDSLLGNPRRTSGTVVAMSVSLAFVLGMGGYMQATKATLERWMDNILTSDLYVRASANLTRADFRFPASLRQELLAVPGVRAVESYRGVRVPYRGDDILLLTIEIGPMLDRTTHDFLEGDEATMRRGLVERRQVAVSDNFQGRFGLGVGDAVELDSPSGPVMLPIAAVVKDYSSDRGSIFMDRALFLELWRDDRVDTYDVSLAAGTDPAAARTEIRRLLGSRMPALISTRGEFTREIGSAIDAFYVLTRVTVLLALVVAFLGIVTSLLISVVERTREIGILKALGASGRQIRTSVVVEALCVALAALSLAIPFGMLHARFMETTVAEVFSGWSMPARFPYDVLLQLAVALPVVAAIAGWLPARAAVATKVTEAIEYE